MIELAEQTAKEFCASILASWFIQSRLGGNRSGIQSLDLIRSRRVQIRRIDSQIEALLEMKRKAGV